MMLHELVTRHRDTILARLGGDAASRTPSDSDLGAPLFLTQLCERLDAANARVPTPTSAIGSSAARHGRQLFEAGFTVSQVVHHYGDICQAITAVATEQDIPIAASEFHILNGCLDAAIAEAVTACARVAAEGHSHGGRGRLPPEVQELRKLVDTALSAFDSLKRNAVTLNGRVGATLGHSLSALRAIVDAAVAEAVISTTGRRREPVNLARFIDEIAVVANLQAAFHEVRLVVAPVDPALTAELDAELIASAVANLLNNAFKFTRQRGRIDLRAYDRRGTIMIAVEDQCGGLASRDGHTLRTDHGRERRTRVRSGLARGLSIARRAVRAHGGDITTRNVPGQGCVFLIALPPQQHGQSALPDIA